MGRGSYNPLLREMERKKDSRLRRAFALEKKYKAWGYETAVHANGDFYYLSKDQMHIYKFDMAEGKFFEI